MISLGVVGAVVAVFGMIVGWIFVGQIATASEDSLDVTVQTLDAVDDTIDLVGFTEGMVFANNGKGVDAAVGVLYPGERLFHFASRGGST